MDNFRTGPKWAVSWRDLHAITAAYGLTATGDPQALGGATNGVVRLGTDCGEVVVRVHRPWTTPARIENIHAIQQRLRHRGLPVPEVLRTSGGATWSLLGDRLIEVAAYVPSDGPADTWERIEVAAALLGPLHSALASLSPSSLVPPAYSGHATPKQALQMLGETEQAFHTDRTKEGYAAAAVARAATYELMRTLAGEWARYAPLLPTQLIHGDYGADNVLLRQGARAAILDFDLMARRERLAELACMLYWSLDRLREPVTAHAILEPDLRHAATLLRRYATASPPLLQTEVDALPFEMARVPLYPLVEAGYAATVPYLPGAVAQTLALARHVPISRWLIRETSRISRILAP